MLAPMRCTSLLFVVVTALAAIGPSPVAAQGETDARAAFEEGRAAYDADHFEDATRAFRRAYLLSPRYQLLYNIAQSELRAGHEARALEAFEAFLRQATPNDPNRSEVEERARMLRGMGVQPEAQGAETESEPEPEPEAAAISPPAEPASADSGPGVAPWILVGTGAAAIVAGGILMGVGISESARVTGATDGSHWADLEGAAANANVYWGVGIGVAAVGLAATGAGIGWALSAGGSSEVVARLRIQPTGVALEGAF
jgi:tetratricopeptide (TPR) repeat protein